MFSLEKPVPRQVIQTADKQAKTQTFVMILIASNQNNTNYYLANVQFLELKILRYAYQRLFHHLHKLTANIIAY